MSVVVDLAVRVAEWVVDGTINLSARLHGSRVIDRSDHRLRDQKVLGNLRAGNSGIMSDDGDVAGSCHRVAHLRQLGIVIEEPLDSTQIMWQLGTVNEEIVYRDLMRTLSPGEIVLREEEIPIEWMTENGTKVTGRPDIVICTTTAGVLAPAPVLGIEVKSVASVWTSREVLFEGRPKMEHLIQAGHYSWKLGVPFRLLYKQYQNQAIPSWAQKFFPKAGREYSEYVEYKEKGDIKHILPFEISYSLEWDKKGVLKYRREYADMSRTVGPWQKSLVTQADIERYYEFISEMAETGSLGPRPMTVDSAGKEKNFSTCDYCPLQGICDATEERGLSYGDWLERVQTHARGLQAQKNK